jgi:hypothetical protein
MDEVIRIVLPANLQEYANASYTTPNTFHNAEKVCIDSLKKIIKKEIDCCFIANKKSESCSLCISNEEIASYLRGLGATAFPITIPSLKPEQEVSKVISGSLIDYSQSSSIVIEGRLVDIENNVNDFLNALSATYSIKAFLTSNESFCNIGQINQVKNAFLSGGTDINIWFHILKPSRYNKNALLLLLDKSRVRTDWSSANGDINNICRTWFTQYAFAGGAPLEVDTDSLPPKLGLWEGMFNTISGRWSYNRAIRFADQQAIPADNMFFYSVDGSGFPTEWGISRTGIRTFVVINHEKTGEDDDKHIFREAKQGCYACPFVGDCCETKWDEWDLYWDSQTGTPILTKELVESVSPLVSVDLPCTQAASKTIKAGVFLVRLGNSSSNAATTWKVYTFLTATGKYVGLTVDFTRRMHQHGARILNKSAQLLFENIPDRITARGLEQILIEDGRRLNVLTEQIDSIRKARKERLEEGVEKAVLFLQQNYPSEVSKLQPAIDYLRTFY